MKQNALLNKKGRKLFIKRCLKYMLFLLIFVAMLTPLIWNSYTLARQLTIDRSEAKLVEGVLSLESQVTKAKELANLIREEESFKTLFFLNGEPSSENYIDMKQLNEKLRRLTLTQELVSSASIYFRDNPVYVSNYFSSDQVLNAYDKFHHYESYTFSEWRNFIFSGNYEVKFLKTLKLQSNYYSSRPYETFTILFNNTYLPLIDDLRSVLALDMDTKTLMKQFLFDEHQYDQLLLIADQNDNVLYSNQDVTDLKLGEIAHSKEFNHQGQAFVALVEERDFLGLKVIMGLPLSGFQQNIHEMLELVLVYILIGIVLIVCISLYFSWRETKSIKPIIELASKASNTTFKNTNEYSYLNQAMSTIQHMQEEHIRKISELNQSIQGSILKQMLVLGAYTEKEIDEAEYYFGHRFHSFRVIKISFYSENSDMDFHQMISLELEYNLRSLIDDEFVSLFFNSGEVVFVVFTNGETVDDLDRLQAAFMELIRKMHHTVSVAVHLTVGISNSMNNITQAKEAHQQAIYAVSSNQSEVSSGVYRHEASPQQQKKSLMDVTILLKIYDALVAGEKETVQKLLKEQEQVLKINLNEESQQLQIYFSLRQAVENAYYVIFNHRTPSATDRKLEFPVYDPAASAAVNMGHLAGYADLLCEVVLSHKKSNNDKLKVDILAFIQENYAEVSLSANKIAEQFLISEKYVFAFIKEQTGKSLGKYMEEVRVQAAEQLLLSTTYSNSTILSMCGFGSENTFYRAFSKKHGVTPTIWRERNRLIKE
ncbi:hypothetical protein B1748_12995 [Paenibacillus sp. MY03]|jgi:AraC-like DNA-binding protein|uniref:helix-turn-helix domain-containing protein n=1 Tax=Paenibacillus sp. MY03 TaxID=302980 RepID=UPI000B3C4DD0|nr:AraC family transcriptional regulator [Paenibacillus sp. MY03]OUS76178.1 hypothetical protein B1748_12995 [Paenibacillus sp. MY03]